MGDQMKMIKIGIMPQKDIRKRTIAIASGQYIPKPGEPKVWFSSIKSLAQVLSDENQALLRVIFETEPNSISELEAKTGRKVSNLSRSLKTLANYGFVELIKQNKKIKPITKAMQFNVTFGVPLDKAA